MDAEWAHSDRPVSDAKGRGPLTTMDRARGHPGCRRFPRSGQGHRLRDIPRRHETFRSPSDQHAVRRRTRKHWLSVQGTGSLPEKAAPSPGSVEFILRSVGDSNEDGQFDQLDITLALQGGKYMTGLPATWAEGDWTGDGLFDQRDIVAALQDDSYMQPPLAAETADEVFADLG